MFHCNATRRTMPWCVFVCPLLQMLSFRESISVPADATQPVIKCEVSFTADSGELARQTITINTGATAGAATSQLLRCELLTVLRPTCTHWWPVYRKAVAALAEPARLCIATPVTPSLQTVLPAPGNTGCY